jgi:ribokinase
VRLAVVGHIEWIRFAKVPAVPPAGGIAHATEAWEGVGGGGGVAATQLAKLGGDCLLLTAIGRDHVAEDARSELEKNGIEVHAAIRDRPTRTALTMIDDAGERTIVTLGDRLAPHEADPLPWGRLEGADGVYFTAGDVSALEAARRARVVVATSRELGTLRRAGVELDALVGSGEDLGEQYHPGDLDPPPKLVVSTAGPLGGWTQPGGPFRAAPLPGPISDAYGAGDSFAAALTYALAKGLERDDALELASRAGAAAMTGKGPYEGQLNSA